MERFDEIRGLLDKENVDVYFLLKRFSEVVLNIDTGEFQGVPTTGLPVESLQTVGKLSVYTTAIQGGIKKRLVPTIENKKLQSFAVFLNNSITEIDTVI